MPRKKTKEEFIHDAREVWGNRYDYSLVDYVNSKTQVIIRCIKHDATFPQTPFAHVIMKRQGCPICQEDTKEQVRRRRAIGTEKFIQRAKERFGNSFDYSEVEYVNSDTPVKIICVKGGHGPFKITPYSHLKSIYGCKYCAIEHNSMGQRIGEVEFLERAKQKFGSKFDYSQITYSDYTSPIKVICKEHGVFETTPFHHLKSHLGCCRECLRQKVTEVNRSMTTEQFIEQAISIHGNKYDYSFAKYTSWFEISPEVHLKGKGCQLCEQEEIAMYEEGKIKAIRQRSEYRKRQAEKRIRSKEVLKGRPHVKYTWDEFVHYAKLIHGMEYDYRHVEKEFIDMNTDVTIICKRHGTFPQKPVKHLKGQGCPRCIGRLRTTESFIEEAMEVHKGHYTYDNVRFVDYATPVNITCKIHGDFPMRPLKHLRGEGCRLCQTSKMELEIIAFLQSHMSTRIEIQKHFSWLKVKQLLHLDIYLPEYKIAIECQGEQHFVEETVFERNESLEIRQERDRIKSELCKKHGIHILYYARSGDYLPNKYLGPIYTTHEKLLKGIKDYTV